MKNNMKDTVITKNKKAYFDYEVLDSWEAGIELFWHEVKSVRAGHVNLKWSYISLLSGKRIGVVGTRRVTAYGKIACEKLVRELVENGVTTVSGSLIKLRVWLCKWRKEYDKKQVLKERTLDKEAKMMMKKFL